MYTIFYFYHDKNSRYDPLKKAEKKKEIFQVASVSHFFNFLFYKMDIERCKLYYYNNIEIPQI